LMIGVLASVIAIGFTTLLLHNSIGIGSKDLPAPQANLMATIIQGMLSQSLPWSLVLIGMACAAVVELCGVSSLAFAVGAYLPLSTTTPIYIGGLIKGFIESRSKSAEAESEIGSGALFSSGLIAGGAITGILVAVFIGTAITGSDGKATNLMSMVNTGLGEHLGGYGDLLGLAMFLGLCAILYIVALQKSGDK
jgi:uncharacterized oligopeptide transporter (OPT) family protein